MGTIMSKKILNLNENFYTSSLFTFTNPSVLCSLETSSYNKKVSKYQFRIQRDKISQPIKFAYKSANGLVRINSTNGSVEEANILGDFLKIYKITPLDKRTNKYLEFFNNNGFIKYIDEEDIIALEDLDLISKRLAVTLDLLSNIYQAKTNRYENIEKDINFLLLNNEFISQFSAFTQESVLISNKESLYDPIYEKYGIIDTSLINDIISNSNEYEDLHSIENFINCLYKYYDNNGTNSVWFLYVSYIVNKYINNFNQKEPSIDKAMKNALIRCAKEFYKEEIDFYIQSIKPIYNVEKNGPDWNIDSLLSALYLSIFYLNPRQEIYKECDYCGKPFLMKTTASNKKYCSTECANKATQARFRAKKKESATN